MANRGLRRLDDMLRSAIMSVLLSDGLTETQTPRGLRARR
jgi:hypothetical protein